MNKDKLEIQINRPRLRVFMEDFQVQLVVEQF